MWLPRMFWLAIALCLLTPPAAFAEKAWPLWRRYIPVDSPEVSDSRMWRAQPPAPPRPKPTRPPRRAATETTLAAAATVSNSAHKPVTASVARLNLSLLIPVDQIIAVECST